MRFVKYILKLLSWMFVASLVAWYFGFLKVAPEKLTGGVKLKPTFNIDDVQDGKNLYSREIMRKYLDFETELRALLGPQASAINPEIWNRTIFTLKSDTRRPKDDRFILFSIPLKQNDNREQAKDIASLIQSYLQTNKDKIEKKLSIAE